MKNADPDKYLDLKQLSRYPSFSDSTIRDCLSDPYVVLGREMTKKFETFLRGPVSQVLEKLAESPIKGEITVVVQRTQEKA